MAVTRAKDRLWLLRAERRAFRGKIAQRVPSRFLAEIPEELLEKKEERSKPAVDAQLTRAGAAGLLAALAGPPQGAFRRP